VDYILPILGADPLGPISTIIDTVVGVNNVIIQTNFRFNIFRGFTSTGGRNFHFPIDFAGHRYNSVAATAQPVISRTVIHAFSPDQPASLTQLAERMSVSYFGVKVKGHVIP